LERTVSLLEVGVGVGVQSPILAVPTGMPDSENEPSEETRVQCAFGTTRMSARIFEWMLQKISTAPGLSRLTGLEVSPPLTEPRSNELPDAVANTLWMTVSWVGKMRPVPRGTAARRGANCLSFCLISTVCPRAGLARTPSR